MILHLNEAKANFKEVKPMKRTMKKHLSLILAVLMLVSSVGINVIAASDCQHAYEMSNPDYQKVINPTCDEMGYTMHLCIHCGEKGAVKDNFKPALGHKYSEDRFEEDEDNECFYKYQECTREFVVDGERVSCGSRSYETENGEKVVYYLVRFVNNRVVDTYDEEIKYAAVADTYKSELLYSEYVKKGDEAVYECDTVPVTGKTKEYGKYSHIGWTTDADLAVSSDESKCESLFDISANTTFYPVFAGEYVEYGVVFHSLDNTPLTRTQDVEHGKSATYRVGGIETNDYYPDPTKAEDITNTYSFAGWINAYDSSKPIPTKEIENTPIYGPVTFYPSFNATKKNYTLELYDADKNLLVVNGKQAVFNNINLETNILDPDQQVNAAAIQSFNTASVLTKESDNTYFYTWNGKWQVIKEDGSFGRDVDLKNLMVNPTDIITAANGEKIIRLAPVFNRTLIRYAVEIEMGRPYGEDMNYYLGEAEVQVVANNNQLVAVGKTDANGIFRCHLNYQVPFTVRIASYEGKYLGNAIITSLSKSPKGEEDEYKNYNHVLVAMEYNPEYETHCRCIHHNAFIQPIFVRILNILYGFFKVKYVCCYDMYSTIGPLLDYTPD